MFRRTRTRQLARVPLLDGLTEHELATVDRLTTPVEVRAGTRLVQEGGAGNKFFIVLDGTVDVFRDGEVIATRGPGSHLGEISLLDGRNRRTATLVTTTPVRAAVASRAEFEVMLDKVPVLSERLERTAAARRDA